MFNHSFVSLRENIWRVMLCLLIISTISSNSIVYAADGDKKDEDPFGAQLCKVVSTLNGNIAKAIATVAIFALGVGLFMGKLNWSSAAITSIGIITIFSAGTIVKWLGGKSTEGCIVDAEDVK